MKKLIIIGGYGNGTVVQSTVEDINKESSKWNIIGFLNDYEEGEINGVPILGKITNEVVQEYLKDEEVYFFYTLISAKLNYKYIDKLHNLNIPRERFATVIHPTAVISDFAQIGHGVCIQPFVSVGPNVQIDNHVQIFAQSLIGHGATLEDYSYVANNACVGADVMLKEGAYLGTNCTTIENISVGKWSLVGMGSVILNDIPDYKKVVGNPGRIIGDT